jgi:RNA polymerase sigma factor (TIGR02999 family)
LQATALVHEAFLRLAAAEQQPWKDSRHLLALASRAIRRVLVNHAIARRTQRRGSGKSTQDVQVMEVAGEPGLAPVDVLAMTEALDELEQLDKRQAEIVELRFFGGLDNVEIARVLGVSLRTVEAEWGLSRAWLQRRLGQEGAP